MKKLVILCILFVFSSSVFAQNEFHAFLDSVNKIEDSTARVAFVEAYMTYVETEQTPLIEGDTAIFIYYGKADSVNIAGDFNGWGGVELWLCNNIEKTNLYYFKQTFEPTARLDYKLIINGSSWIVDPLNPNQVSGGYGSNSELAMPEYVQPWEIELYEGVAQGSIETFSLTSNEIGKDFEIQVYLPPGYDKLSNLSVAYVHDGHEYLSLGSMQNVIENMLDSNKIDPIIGVFIRPNNRNDEYAFDNRFSYASFVAETVVPYIDENYKTDASKEHRLTMGASFGGNISGIIAYTYSEVFGNSAWHSPAFWPNDGEVALMYLEAHKDIKIYFNVGTYESLGVDWDLFAEGLQTLGYEFSWNKYHEGHSWGLWRATIDNMLSFIFPKGSTNVGIQNFNMNELVMQNHPNPFKTNTTVSISGVLNADAIFTVYNVIGQPVFNKMVGASKAGNKFVLNTETWPSGIYYYTLKTKNDTYTLKMIKK